MLVAFGLSEAALDAVDGGQKRLVRDVFRIHNVANSSVTGAAIRLLVGYEDSGGIEAHRPSYVTSGPKAMAALERHLGILDFPAPRSTPNGLLSPAAILWLRYETDKIDSDFALKFWDWVLLGQGPGINEIPMANVLRRRLESLYDSRSGEGRAWIRLRLAIRAWNAARAGETLTKIQTPTGLIRISGRVEPETMADEPDDLDDLDEAEEPTPVRPAYVESLFG